MINFLNIKNIKAFSKITIKRVLIIKYNQMDFKTLFRNVFGPFNT